MHSVRIHGRCKFLGLRAVLPWSEFNNHVISRSGGSKQRFYSKGRKYDVHGERNDEIDLLRYPPERIRNFCIVAHVDHGKSTLADRMLEITGAISANVENKQVLDKLQVERDRGITVKAQTASIIYRYKEEEYLLNLIDTPGHVDFSYEVSRSLSVCQGVVLLVDATQGVQAQTLSNFYLTMEIGLEVIPVLNKIDVKSANVEAAASEMEKLLDVKKEEIIKVSAKTGENVSSIFQAIIGRLPSPKMNLAGCDSSAPLKALVFDSSYERYKGVNACIAVASGTIKVGDKVTSPFLSSLQNKSKMAYEVKNIGVLRPEFYSTGILYAGQVGGMFCGMKSTREARIGDTFHHVGVPVEPFASFRPAKAMVFGSMFPTNQSENSNLRKALDKLTLNDSSVCMEPCVSTSLGHGFRLGFLGLLHMEVFQQRLEQEYDASVICTTPTVPYKAVLSSPAMIKKHRGKDIMITNASDFPERTCVENYLQPIIRGTIIAPSKYYEAIRNLCMSTRMTAGMQRDGVEEACSYLSDNRVVLIYKLPLNEVVVDFYDKLKTLTSGYGSFDYEDAGYEGAKLVKVDILINDVIVPELSSVFNEEKSVRLSRKVCLKLKESIPRQLFLIVIQAVIGKKVIAREQISALRKDVTAKCYGGDITRRMKLLRNQREGKKRMRQIGRVEVPKDAFIKVLQD